MSLFEEQHHDQFLLSRLDIDSVKTLSLVNKHYYNITKNILQPFREFFATRNNIKVICKMRSYDSNVTLIEPNKLQDLDIKNIMFIQACIHNNLEIVEYIYKTCKPDIFEKTITITIDDDYDEVYAVYRLVLEICLIKKQKHLTNWLINMKIRICRNCSILLSCGREHMIGDDDEYEGYSNLLQYAGIYIEW